MTDRNNSVTIMSRLGELSANVLNHSLPTEYLPLRVRATYLHALRDHGLLTRSGLVRARSFLKWIRDSYQAATHFPPYDWILSEQHIEALLRLVRKPRSDFHTAYHVMLIDALFGSWDRFAEVYAWEEAMDPPYKDSIATALPNTSPIENNGRLVTLVQRARSEERSISSLCLEMGIEFQTATRQLAGCGAINIRRRPKILTAELRLAVVNSLRCGENQRDIARHFSLSRATVDRICQETTGLHNEWSRASLERKRVQSRAMLVDFLSQHPGTTRKVVQGHPKSGYIWLRQHDAKWLDSQIPRATGRRKLSKIQISARVNWASRDLECLLALQKVAQAIQFEPGERVQPGVILRKLPSLSFVPRLERLPQSRDFVSAMLARYRTSEY